MKLAKLIRQMGRASFQLVQAGLWSTGGEPCVASARSTAICVKHELRKNRERGSAIVIAMIMTILLALLGLAYAMTAVTDSLISNSGRQSMNTYYIAEAGREEALNAIMTTSRTQFNPMNYTGTFPVDVTRCFYNDNAAPSCPPSVGAGSALVSVPVSIATGEYKPQIQYLGRYQHVGDAAWINKYLVFSTGTLNATSFSAAQTASSLIYTLSVENAFPHHPVTSCTEPRGSGPWRIEGDVSINVPDPFAPSPSWPGTTDPNHGTTPLCTIPFYARIQQAIETNADYSYSSSVSNPAGPSTFWKVAPGGIDPTGEAYKTYVNGDLTINGNTTVYGVFYVTGNVTFNGSANIQGIIYAPNGTFTGHGGGSPSSPDATGGIYANAIDTTGNHYYALYNAAYVNAYLGQIPYRMSRGGR